jgi:glycosyltransferase involved in cell wall biosynthesis
VRLLFVTHGYPPHGVAGVERVVEQTGVSLAARGHAISVLTRRPTPAPPTLALERERRDGVSVLRIAGGDSTFGTYPGHEDALEELFLRVLAETTPDAVVVSHLMHHSAQYVGIAQAWRIPVVLELHDFYAACPLAHLRRVSGERCDGPAGGATCAAHCFSDQASAHSRWAMRALEFEQAVRQADAVVAPSRFVADYFAPMRGDAPAIHVIGNGVGLSPRRRGTPPKRQPLHLASIGVVVEHKGHDVVVEALRLARLDRVRYSLFGTAVESYARALREAAEAVPGLELGLFGAFLPRTLPALLHDVDLVVVPSIVWETYSVAAREALACGVPVLASRLGALPEAVRDGENGLLFEPGSSRDLAAVIRALDADRPLLARLGRGIRSTDYIGVEDRTSAVEALLRDIVATSARPAPDWRRGRAMRGALR